MPRTSVISLAFSALAFSQAIPLAVAADTTPFKTTLETISVSRAVRVRIENTDHERSWSYDARQLPHLSKNFSVTGPDGKPVAAIDDGARFADTEPIEIGPGESQLLYPTFMIGSVFAMATPGKYQLRFKGWDASEDNPRVRAVPPSEEIKVIGIGQAPSFWDEYIRRVLPIKPANWEFTDRANAVYRPVAGHKRDVYGVSFLQLLHRGKGTAASPRATIELWSTDPKGTRQMPSLSGKPAAAGEWTYLTTMSRGDIYLRADIEPNSVALETLWPNAHAAISGALKTGGAAGLSEAQRTALSPTWDTISVVRNWGELRALAPFTIRNEVRGRVGIDRLSAARWDHTLLYRLVDSAEAGGLIAGFESRETIGSIMIEGDGGRIEMFRWQGDSIGIFRPPDGTREILYVVVGPMDSALDKYIELTIPWSMMPFAQVRVENTGEGYHPWIPIYPSAANGANARHLTVPANTIATPNLTGALPFARTSADAKVADETPLPGLETTPTLKLTATAADDVIEATVSSDDEFPRTRTQTDYLARWWVNGKAFTSADPKFSGSFRATAEGPAEREHRFQIDFRAAALGAKTGDKIGLQLLHVADAKRFLDREILRKRLAAYSLQRAPRLTNKVEFTAP